MQHSDWLSDHNRGWLSLASTATAIKDCYTAVEGWKGGLMGGGGLGRQVAVGAFILFGACMFSCILIQGAFYFAEGPD